MPDLTRRSDPARPPSDLGDAVVIGLGSMIGAGIFSVFGPAARAAGAGLVDRSRDRRRGRALQRARRRPRSRRRYPASGGAYVYGRRAARAPFWGYLAGWGFVVGKTASCAAMALTVGAVRRTRTVTADRCWRRGRPHRDRSPRRAAHGVGSTRAIVAVVLVVARRWSWSPRALGEPRPRATSATSPAALRGILEVGRSAVLRVRRLRRASPPSARRCATRARTIPKAIPLALGLTLVVYAVVAVERARRRRTGRRWRPSPRRSPTVVARRRRSTPGRRRTA